MGVDWVMNYVLQKLKELLLVLENFTKRVIGVDMGMNYVLEKLKEFLLVVENSGGNLVGWLDKVFPPETRGKQLLQLAAPFLITGVVLFVFFRCGGCLCHCFYSFGRCFFKCFNSCCRCLYNCCRYFFKCCYSCCCGGWRTVKMMKAPGRNFSIPRYVFESNPGSYFRNLRANP
uniref:Uncharacterized protein n=1 Tax=Davidia involucrata TaxID=16924 RepID=A0A5B7AUY1_DAVIN